MGVAKLPSGRWQAVLKIGRDYAGSASFTTKKEAENWLTKERAKVKSGIDPRAGKVKTRILLDEWLSVRVSRVAPKTAKADRELLRLVSPALGALYVSAVEKRHIDDWFDYLRHRGLAHSSIIRHRASLSAFFNWCVDERRIAANPVASARVPPKIEEPDEMKPFTREELENVYKACRVACADLAEVVLVAGWTGLRWGELRSLRVSDVIQVPYAAFRVVRSQTEGGKVKVTKGRESRTVPIADRVLPIIKNCCAGANPDDLLFQGVNGGQLWRATFVRLVNWKTNGQGRRIHDLRHTAACLWLSLGVDPGTVQAWMGHASIVTTNKYLHYLGTSADKAGLALLNKAGGNEGAISEKGERATTG